MCIGSKWATKYRDVVNTFGEKTRPHSYRRTEYLSKNNNSSLYKRSI